MVDARARPPAVPVPDRVCARAHSIYSWIEQKKVCPLCKADVHRSHVRPLFMNFNEGGGDAPGDGDDVAAGAQTAVGAASDRREVEAAHAQIVRRRRLVARGVAHADFAAASCV